MSMPEKLKKLLEDNGVGYRVIEHAPAYTAQHEAQAAHVPGQNWAKTVVVWVDDRPAMAVLPATRQLDLDRFRSVTGSNDTRLAAEDEFAPFYPDCEPGTMPPFGNLYNQRTFVDESLRADERIAFHAGDHRTAIEMPYAAFERLANATPGRFSREAD